MTRQQALAKHFANGHKTSIKNAYTFFGISNISREIRRLIEKPFNVELNREQKQGKTKYGSPCYWFEYSANKKTQAILKREVKKLSK